MIQYSGMDVASSLLSHWCQLGVRCIDVPGLSYHHIRKVTIIKLSLLVSFLYHSKKSHIQVLICDNLRAVTIKYSGMDVASSLLMHWCQLWLRCIDVPGVSYHHIIKVTEIKLSLLVSLVYHSKKSHIQVLICEKWRTVTIKLAVWMQPLAYWRTDVNFDSDILMCLDFHITILANSLKSNCHFFWARCIIARSHIFK